MGEIELASREIDKAISADEQSAASYLQAAFFAAKLKDNRARMLYLRKAIKNDPQNPLCFFRHAEALFDEGDFKGASLTFQFCLEKLMSVPNQSYYFDKFGQPYNIMGLKKEVEDRIEVIKKIKNYK
jgi:Tfp pilus assembly protein PilF